MIPAVSDATHDRALRGTPLAVYHHLVDPPAGSALTPLHPTEWRRLKLAVLCFELGISKRTAQLALTALVRSGYLERTAERAHGGNSRSYRLVYSRPVPRAVDSRGTNPAA